MPIAANHRAELPSLLESLKSAAVRLAQSVIQSTRRAPLFVWVYLGVIVYLYHRMTRDFLGVGTRKKLIHGRLKLEVSREEETLSADIVDPAEIRDSFATVGGLEDAKRLLIERVVWPFNHPELFPPGSLHSPPSGVLLYGPPGTGKTLLARALAKELNGYFLEVRVERLFAKWVGDSEKMAAAVFSLAHKLGSCVIFVDEIDALLSSRQASDTAVYTHAKTIFMTKWDGIVQQHGSRVVVVGATNRPLALDDAILRRLPIRVGVPRPSLAARQQILRIHLAERLAGNPAAEAIVDGVAAMTDGFSGSDLKELCKAAAMVPIRSVMERREAALPPMCLAHFVEALQSIAPTTAFKVSRAAEELEELECSSEHDQR